MEPVTALTERFGLGITHAGPLLNTAAATHLAASSSAAVARWSAGEPHAIGTRAEQQSSTGCKPASAFAWSADDLPLYELSRRGKQLVAKATGSGGRTVECFSPAAQLNTLMSHCKGGEASFNEAAFATLEKLARTNVVGGVALDWFQVGFDEGGTLGAICFTCDDDRKAKALGSSARRGPLANLVSHCEKAKKHEQAREKLRAQIDELHRGLQERGEDTVTRCARCTHTAPPYPFEPPASRPCATGKCSQRSCSKHGWRAQKLSSLRHHPRQSAHPASRIPISSRQAQSTWVHRLEAASSSRSHPCCRRRSSNS